MTLLSDIGARATITNGDNSMTADSGSQTKLFLRRLHQRFIDREFLMMLLGQERIILRVWSLVSLVEKSNIRTSFLDQ